MRRKNKHWNTKEIQFLKKHYGCDNTRLLAKKLKRTIRGVTSKALELHLKKSKKYMQELQKHISPLGIRASKEKYGNIGKHIHRVWKEKDSEGYRKHQSRAGKKSILLGYGIRKNDKRKKIIDSRNIKEWTEKNPEIAKKFQFKKGEKRLAEYGKKVGRQYGGKFSHLAFQSRQKNTPYDLDGEKFLSKQEMDIYKWYVHSGLSKKNINHNFNINRWYIDFFPFKKFFHEHHPILTLKSYKEKTMKEYYIKRRKILDENGYKDYPLIVTESLKEMEEKVLPLLK